MLLSTKSGTFGAGPHLHPAFFLVSWMVCSNLTIIFNKWIIDTAGFAMILTTIHLTVAVVLTQMLKYTTGLIPSPKTPMKWRVYFMIIVPLGSLYTSSLLCSNLAYFTLSISFIAMLKALSPITTLVITWCAFFTEPSRSKLVNVVVIALGVLLSSLGEVTFAWTGFFFQMSGTVAESARLVLIQWLLTARQGRQGDNRQQPQRAANTSDEETGLAASSSGGSSRRSSSSSSSSSSDCESGAAGDVGATSGRYSDGEDWSSLPTHGHGAAQASRDDIGRGSDEGGEDGEDGEDEEEEDIAIMSPLALLYYYAPVCALLNGLTALIFEAPQFDWNDLNRVGVGMLALSGGLAFLLNLTSVFLIGKTSALTMNLAGILKSLLLVGASAIIWATQITLLQGIGYAVSLAGMFYYALPSDSEPPHAVLMAYLRGCASRSKGGQSQTWFSRVGDPIRGLGRYRSIPEDQDTDHEGSVLLDEIDGPGPGKGQ